jgi:hypothetical protein
MEQTTMEQRHSIFSKTCIIACLCLLSVSTGIYSAGLLDDDQLNTDSNKLNFTGRKLGINNPTLDTELDVNGSVYFRQTATFYEVNGIAATSNTNINWEESNFYKITVDSTAARTINLQSLIDPDMPTSMLLIIYHQVGDTNISWSGSIKWPNNLEPFMSDEAGDIDIISLYYNEGDYYAVPMLNFDN